MFPCFRFGRLNERAENPNTHLIGNFLTLTGMMSRGYTASSREIPECT